MTRRDWPDQGRHSVECTNASRAALGMSPLPGRSLNRQDGGEHVDTPSNAAVSVEASIWIVIAISLLTIAFGLAAALAEYLS